MASRRRRALETMSHPIHFLLVLGTLVYPAIAQAQSCFETLGALNSVMQTELIRIQNGATPKDAYTYNLCPNTFFDATSTALEPVLNNAMFVCGDDGSRLSQCVILGGSEQVSIVDSLVNGYPLEELSFMGITFSAFESNTDMSGTSIAASASSATTATFTDCAWQDFASDFVILQRAAGNFFGPMTVQVERSTVQSGAAGAVFDNDGGLLRISDIDVTNVTAAALVATANNGASFLEKSKVSLSDMNSITYATAGGSQTVTSTTVTQMNRMEDAFYVEGNGSTLLLNGVAIESNQKQTVPWSAVSARANAIARVSEISISDNTAVEFGVVAFESTVSIQDSFISRNSGSESQGTISALIFAITDATVNVDRVELNENSGFSGSVVALIRSNVSINKSCFQGGSSVFVVFIANDATYEASENFIDNLTSQRCEATGPRLFQEDAASGCFLGSSMCEGTCLVVADQDACRAQEVPTIAPTIFAPSMPSSAPMLSPVPVTTTSPPALAPNSNTTVAPASTPAVSPMDSFSAAPSEIPSTITVSPTIMPSIQRAPIPSMMQPSLAPSTTRLSQPPSRIPTTSPAPTISSQPTLNPTVSTQPTTSSVPSAQPSGSPSFSESENPTIQKSKGSKKSKGGMMGMMGKGGKGMKKNESKVKGGKGGKGSKDKKEKEKKKDKSKGVKLVRVGETRDWTTSAVDGKLVGEDDIHMTDVVEVAGEGIDIVPEDARIADLALDAKYKTGDADIGVDDDGVDIRIGGRRKR